MFAGLRRCSWERSLTVGERISWLFPFSCPRQHLQMAQALFPPVLFNAESVASRISHN